MSADVDIRLDVDELKARLNRMSANAATLPMDAFAAMVVADVDDMFQTQGASGSDGEWAPFQRATLIRHPRRIGGMLLQDTGATANIQVAEVTEQSFRVRSPTAYAGFHVRGTRFMEKRNFFALNFPDLLERMSELALEELKR
jgi:hypothetical protein